MKNFVLSLFSSIFISRNRRRRGGVEKEIPSFNLVTDDACRWLTTPRFTEVWRNWQRKKRTTVAKYGYFNRLALPRHLVAFHTSSSHRPVLNDSFPPTEVRRINLEVIRLIFIRKEIN